MNPSSPPIDCLPLTAKMNSPLLPLVLLFLAVSPLAAARPAYTECTGDTAYAANSTYEANLHRLAAALRAAASASESPYAHRAIGFWPNRVAASSLCRRRDDDGNGGAEGGHRYSACAACIAGAFRQLQSACPGHREAFFSDRNCTLQYHGLITSEDADPLRGTTGQNLRGTDK